MASSPVRAVGLNSCEGAVAIAMAGEANGGGAVGEGEGVLEELEGVLPRTSIVVSAVEIGIDEEEGAGLECSLVRRKAESAGFSIAVFIGLERSAAEVDGGRVCGEAEIAGRRGGGEWIGIVEEKGIGSDEALDCRVGDADGATVVIDDGCGERVDGAADTVRPKDGVGDFDD